jgi:RNA polymerase sigma factor (TIGR02999 family)
MMDPDAMSESCERTSRLLARVAHGDEAAAAELLAELYDELRRIAHGCMADERSDHTLQPTALVHEAYVRLFAGGAPELEDRVHFVRLAARAMRNVLIDHARARHAAKRGAGQPREALDHTLAALEEGTCSALDLEPALQRLERLDAELARLVELRFFAGLTLPDIAALEGVSVPTLERRWRVARSWLRGELGEGGRAD